MAQTSNDKRENNEQRVHRLQDQLQHLDPQTPFYVRERELLTRELQLMKAKSPHTRGAGQQKKAGAKKIGSVANKKTTAKKRTVSNTPKSTPTDALGNGLGTILSPKNFKESINTISTLRGWSKQMAKYVHQADNLLDTLFITANSLQESGVLKKLAETKGKKLNTGDLTSILMALMNSPLGNTVFKKLSGNEDGTGTDETKTTDAPQATPVSETQASLPAPSTSSPPAQAMARTQPAIHPYGMPLPPGGPAATPPPYGMPPNGRPM